MKKKYGDRVNLFASVPPDIVQRLKDWAATNASSVTSELVRSVRERAQRLQAEQREQVQ